MRPDLLDHHSEPRHSPAYSRSWHPDRRRDRPAAVSIRSTASRLNSSENFRRGLGCRLSLSCPIRTCCHSGCPAAGGGPDDETADVDLALPTRVASGLGCLVAPKSREATRMFTASNIASASSHGPRPHREGPLTLRHSDILPVSRRLTLDVNQTLGNPIRLPMDTVSRRLMHHRPAQSGYQHVGIGPSKLGGSSTASQSAAFVEEVPFMGELRLLLGVSRDPREVSGSSWNAFLTDCRSAVAALAGPSQKVRVAEGMTAAIIGVGPASGTLDSRAPDIAG